MALGTLILVKEKEEVTHEIPLAGRSLGEFNLLSRAFPRWSIRALAGAQTADLAEMLHIEGGECLDWHL